MISLVGLNYLIENTILSLGRKTKSAKLQNLMSQYRDGKATFQFTVHFGEIYLGVLSKTTFSDRYYIKFHFVDTSVREREAIFDYRPILTKFLEGDLPILEEDFINLAQIYSMGEVLQAREDLSHINLPNTKDFKYDWQVSSEGFLSIEGVSAPYFLKIRVVTLNLLIIAMRSRHAERFKEKIKKL